MKYLLALVAVLFLATSCKSKQNLVRTTKTEPKIKTVKTKPVAQNSANQTQTTKSNNPKKTETIVSTSNTVVYTEVVQSYVNDFKDVAMSNMRTYGIPASIILAQGILESGAGRGRLAVEANNHFGIKCHKDWTGESVRHDDDSEQECFRKYNDASESYRDHAVFLTGRQRYASLFQLEKNDYEAWARGLKNAGYATDPKYPEKLISYIERYELAQYDAAVLGKNYIPKQAPAPVVTNTEVDLYEVQKGDTLYSISKRFGLSVEELKSKNNLADNAIAVGQKIKIK